ncbi:vacuolar ATPase assembly integral membrane protein VMA21 isoform X1 [Marmota monax]|uniref:vacuolar ATPase assembly integral membrane protein VMA21 isoform X1 n=1 Tax=Marmota monax TaxID=9995 RepID=UPI0026EC5AE3|nr:vacuolar ATPase assembly integral membrane protein VMA21 isoform X1 [Marmota monax]
MRSGFLGPDLGAGEPRGRLEPAGSACPASTFHLGRTDPGCGRRDGCIFSGWITTSRLMGFTAWTGVCWCWKGFQREKLTRQNRSESSLASTLKTLLFFTALMITVPIGLYFTTKSYIFEGILGMSNRDSYFYAAIVAVVAVHVVLALFVYVAWNEGSRQWREGKQD